MGVLHRYEDSDDDARRIPVKRSRGWRYDETSSDVSSDCASQSDSSSIESSGSEILGWHPQVSASQGISCCAIWSRHPKLIDNRIDNWNLLYLFSCCRDGLGWPEDEYFNEVCICLKMVDLKLCTLQSLQGSHETGDASSFARNGVSIRRIKKCLKHPRCKCRCSLPFKVLYQTCRHFWGCSKSAQDAILWSLQSGSNRKSWSIEGQGCVKKVFKSQC